MKRLELKSHHKTSNIYVKKSIVIDNILLLGEYKLKDTIYINSLNRVVYVQRELDRQLKFLKLLNETIKEFEQLSFAFGAFCGN